MKNYYFYFKFGIIAFIGLLFSGGVVWGQTTEPFGYTGSVVDWTVPAGVNSIEIECWGAGGAGLGSNGSNSSGGGGGGAYAKKTLSVLPGQHYKFYVGKGAATSAWATLPANGENSYFKSFDESVIYALAEGGKSSTNATGATGGQASNSTGDTKNSGGKGGNGTGSGTGGGGGGGAAGLSGGGGNGNNLVGGTGNSGIAGNTGAGRAAVKNNPGAVGYDYGGGGSGTNGNRGGGNGANGYIRITYTIETCSGTPNGGTAVASPATLYCSGSSVLSLSGNSYGIGITYQWQEYDGSSWVNINGADQESYSVTLPALGTYKYRCELICDSDGIPSYSSETEVEVVIGLPPNAPTVNTAMNVNNTSFDISWSAESDVIGYYVDVAKDAAFNDFITGYNGKDVGNVTTWSVTGVLAGTDYYYRVRAYSGCQTSGNSNDEHVETTLNYCSSTGSNQSNKYISNVSFAGINNTTNNSGAAYKDYTAVSGTVCAGSSNPISVSTSNSSNSAMNVNVWIDWNKNGTFESGELLNLGAGSGSGTKTFTGNYVIPSNAEAGNVRMRILCAETNPVFDPCATFSNGEVEDYTIVIKKPVAYAGPLVAAVCPGETSAAMGGSIGGTAMNGIWSGGAGTWSNASDPANATYTAALTESGNITLTLTAMDASCSATDTKVIEVHTPPAVNLGADASYCAGSTFNTTLDAGTGVDYLWSDNSMNQTLTVTSSGTYSVIVTDANGCEGKDTIVITQNALPVINLGPDAAICTGSTLTLDAGAGVDYLWSDNSTNQTLTISSSGMYSVIVTDANSCEGKDTIVITENALPVVDLGPDASYCAGSTFNMTLDAGPGMDYLWSDNSMNQMFTVTSSGMYSVIVTDANGCKGKDTVVVTENALPAVNLGADASYCIGSIFNMTLDAGPGVDYLWSDNSTNQTLVVSSSGIYSVIVTDANNCEGKDTIVITENALPVVNLGLDASYCAGSTLNMILDAGPGMDYLWSDNSTNQTLAVSSSGVYSVIVTDANSCEGKDTIVITENTLPVVNLGPDAAICTGSTLTLNAGSGVDYLWSDNSTNQTLTVSSSGMYSVIVTDANNCEGKDTVVITENALPVVNLGSDAAICTGSTLTLDAGAGLGYLWSDNSTNQTLVISSSGVYSVIVTDANNCEGKDTVVIIENALPVVNLGPDAAICTGSTLTLNAGAGVSCLWSDNSTNQTLTVSFSGMYSVTVTDMNGCKGKDTIVVAQNALPSAGGLSSTLATDCAFDFSVSGVTAVTSYVWNFGDGATATTSIASTSHSYASEGTYTVKVTMSNNCGSIEKQTTVTCDKTAVSDLMSNNRVIIYPNPASANVTVQNADDLNIQSVTVIDNLGKIVYHGIPDSGNTSDFQLNVSEFSNGLYTLRIITGRGIVTERIEVLK